MMPTFSVFRTIIDTDLTEPSATYDELAEAIDGTPTRDEFSGWTEVGKYHAGHCIYCGRSQRHPHRFYCALKPLPSKTSKPDNNIGEEVWPERYAS